VLSNHDQVRHRTRYGSEARARAAAVLSLTMRGTPFLYHGEELGLEDADIPDDRVVDPAGRDGCRAPLPWTADGDAESGHGWRTPPWLPFPRNASTHAAELQVGVEGSMFELYRTLLALRRSWPALRSGAMALAPLDGGLLRYERTMDDERLTVLINLGAADVDWPADVGREGVVLSTMGPAADSVRADEAVVVRH